MRLNQVLPGVQSLPIMTPIGSFPVLVHSSDLKLEKRYSQKN